MTETPSVTPPYAGTDEVRQAIRDAMEGDRKKLTQTQVSKEAGISPTTLSQYLSGSYAGDNFAVENKLRLWLDGLQARRAAAEALPPALGYIATPTAERIVQALRYAQAASDLAIVYGAAGIGKTSAIVRYQQTQPSVWVATMTPAMASVVTCLEEICEALGIKDAGGGAARLHRQITRRIANTAGLLVIDEAQHLSVQALDQVRSIHDATGIGLALVGNESLYTRMTGGNRAPMLDRLYSRIGKRIGIKKGCDDDTAALIEAWGIADAECRHQLLDIARKPGALRGLSKVLRLARMYSAAEGRGICCQDVQAAWRELGGSA